VTEEQLNELYFSAQRLRRGAWLDEVRALLAAPTPIYQIGASTTDGFVWWDVPKDTYQQRKATGYVRVRVVALVQDGEAKC
jgi:hypothetical protein